VRRAGTPSGTNNSVLSGRPTGRIRAIPALQPAGTRLHLLAPGCAFGAAKGEGWISAEWKASENNRRAKFYSLTRLGRGQLQTEAALNKKLVLPNPTIGTFVGHEQNTERFVGVALGIPIPLFNRRQAEATAIGGRLARERSKLRAVELNIEHEVRDAYGRFIASRRALAVSREDVVAPARESFGLLEDAFNAGKLDLLSLSVVERQTFDAQMGYLDAWFNYAAAKTSLDLAVGEQI